MSLPEYTWGLAKAAYDKGAREFLVTPRYPLYPKQEGCSKCQGGCDFVHFHHRDTGYLMLKCSYCSKELKGGLFEIGINDKQVNRKRLFSDWMRWEIFKRDGCKCWNCGAGPSADELEADHIFPARLGGPTIIENGITLCRGCNQAKSGKFDTGLILKALIYANMTPTEAESENPDTAFAVLKRVAGFLKLWKASGEAKDGTKHG